MASTTSNLGLTKPAYTDDADVGDLNGNFDLIDAEAGRVRANFAGTYSTSSAYAVGAYVIYQGNLYKCTTAIGSGGEAWNSAHWDQVSVGTELTALNDHIANYVDITTDTITKTLSAGADASYNTQTMTKSGYTPIMATVRSKAYGTSVIVNLETQSFSNGSASVGGYVKNVTSASVTATFDIVVLWRKNVQLP